MNTDLPPDPSAGTDHDEAAAVVGRYARRPAFDARYSLLDRAALAEQQGRLRAWAGLWADHAGELADWRITEVGCGDGGNLLDAIRLGAQPGHLRGLELLPARAERARARLPASVRIDTGDALAADIAPGSQHAVLQFTVFSSLLDDGFQQRLADAMWRWVRPGGGVLWYDFAVDNPRNRDVCGVPLRRVRELFPQADAVVRRVTLAPPLARAACRVHPLLHGLLAALPPLRTHRLVWLRKAP
ncbi:class I SAM-dependent methyltransferase [Leptothrix discophora]|uniref:Class I SAM-dependent methyltransferase n=1 Tax=Leptothrix discophora TaxID=89 RepID=A0ABT9G8G3_LEPDI|nr:class I SAM-dependent methyltransferase [Leptothrix discophora]MDP4302582.1 class I SAM-dependent methyltransferase [Leptothrix discophora]